MFCLEALHFENYSSVQGGPYRMQCFSKIYHQFLFNVYKYLACRGLIKCHICTADNSTLQYLWKTIAFEMCYNLKLGKTEPKFVKQVSPVMLAYRKGICEGISGLLWLFLVGK